MKQGFNKVAPVEGSLEWFIKTEKERQLPKAKFVTPVIEEKKKVVQEEKLPISTPFLDVGTLYAMKRKTCETLIHIFFFSEVRTNVYKQKENELNDSLYGMLKAYYQNQIQSNLQINFSQGLSHMMNMFSTGINIVDGPGRVVRRTPKLKRNETFIKEAIDIVMKQFEIIMNVSPWGQDAENKTRICSKFESFALAVFSYMKKTNKKIKFTVGNEVYEFVIIPRLEYAVKYAPPTTDFLYYGFKKNLITDGTKIITSAYKSFKNAGVKFPVELFMNNGE